VWKLRERSHEHADQLQEHEGRIAVAEHDLVRLRAK
jgi:hypothetical protein